MTAGIRTFNRPQWLAATRTRNRAFVDEIVARTVCAHCGVDKIEWHNPEHVNVPGRKYYRISNMIAVCFSIAAIEAELQRCTPLCRRCHMIEDGRMSAFIQAGNRPPTPAKPCRECSHVYKPLRRGLCSRCYEQWLYRDGKRVRR